MAFAQEPAPEEINERTLELKHRLKDAFEAHQNSTELFSVTAIVIPAGTVPKQTMDVVHLTGGLRATVTEDHLRDYAEAAGGVRVISSRIERGKNLYFVNCVNA